MSEIKRYEIDGPYAGGDVAIVAPDGGWVTYADHLAAVEAAVMAEREAAAALSDSRGHHWSGAPAHAFFELAEAIRARTTQPAKEAG